MKNPMSSLAQNIIEFIDEQAKNKQANSLIVRTSGGVDTAAAAALCVRTGINTILVTDKSDDWNGAARCKDFARQIDAQYLELNLTNSYKDIISQIPRTNIQGRRCERALKKVLQTPAIDFIAKLNNGILVGAANADEDMFIRCYHRRGSGAVDIQPLAGVHKSEIYGLARYLKIPRNIIDASSSTDIWGGDETRPPEDLDDIHISSVELEWARRQADDWLKALNDWIGVTHDPFPPYVNDFHELDKPLFFELLPKSNYDKNYTDEANQIKEQCDGRQRQIMSKVIDLEFSSRHKVTSIPHFNRNEKYKKSVSLQDFCNEEIQGHSVIDNMVEESADRWL